MLIHLFSQQIFIAFLELDSVGTPKNNVFPFEEKKLFFLTHLKIINSSLKEKDLKTTQ